VVPLLAEAGLRVHETNIGEFVTSLDMAGCSLSLFWLDDDLRALHDAPASSPAYTRFGADGTMIRATSAIADTFVSVEDTAVAEEAGVPGAPGRKAGEAIRRALAAIEEHEDELARLDAAAGDGDHGAGMVRGFTAAVATLGNSPQTAKGVLQRAGRAFQDTAGGASGALVGGLLSAIGAALPADDASVDAGAWATAIDRALATVMSLGGSGPGDKTMIDTLHPFAQALRTESSATSDAGAAWTAALPAAETGMRSTVGMVSRRGRASRLGERSRGHQDPGATSIYYVLQSFGAALSTSD
jgi:dihydroxyacetone kinase phosphoprotein-dependent L subunit